MKRFLTKRFVGFPVYVVLIWAFLVVGLSTALAVSMLVVPSTYRIAPGPSEPAPPAPPKPVYGISANVTSIDWGTISQGFSATREITITNTGNQPVTVVATAIVPEDSGITFTGETHDIPVGGSAVYQLELTASDNATTTPKTETRNLDIIFSRSQ